MSGLMSDENLSEVFLALLLKNGILAKKMGVALGFVDDSGVCRLKIGDDGRFRFINNLKEGNVTKRKRRK